MRRYLSIVVVALLPAVAPVLAQEGTGGTIGGRATVVDASTVEIYGRSIRIYGIDTPERGGPGFGPAAEFMRRAAERGPFICDVVDDAADDVAGENGSGQDTAVCRVKDDFLSEDVAESLLELGLAKTKPGQRHLRPNLISWYEKVEAEAKERCRGLWQELPECE